MRDIFPVEYDIARAARIKEARASAEPEMRAPELPPPSAGRL
jgi:hypothetical protein